MWYLCENAGGHEGCGVEVYERCGISVRMLEVMRGVV